MEHLAKEIVDMAESMPRPSKLEIRVEINSRIGLKISKGFEGGKEVWVVNNGDIPYEKGATYPASNVERIVALVLGAGRVEQNQGVTLAAYFKSGGLNASPLAIWRFCKSDNHGIKSKEISNALSVLDSW